MSFDPTFAYELAVIIQDGLRRMCAEQQDVYYYITVMNENYTHPAMPEGGEAGIPKGMYKRRDGGEEPSRAPSEGSERSARGGTHPPRVQLMGSGVILRQ